MGINEKVFDRIVTHEMAREAFFKLHDHVYNGAPVPLLSIPRRENDVDVILCDYICQYEALEAALEGQEGKIEQKA